MGASASIASTRSTSPTHKSQSRPKILVLGCMGSGKSTLCRQLVRHSRTIPLIYNYYTHTVQHNLLTIWKQLEHVAIELKVDPSRCKDDFYILNEFRFKELFTDKVVEAVRRISQSGLLEECQLKRRHLALPYNHMYFIKSTERILDDRYVPNEQDIFFSYAPTIGLSNYNIRFGSTKYKIVELPGQHIFRRKWNEFFKATTAFVYVVDLAELCDPEFYDGHLVGKTLGIFKNLLESPFFKDVGVILLFNKKDVFDELAVSMNFHKLAQHVGTSEEAVSFYRSQFLTCLPKGRGYHHVMSLAYTAQSACVVDTLTLVLKHNKENMEPE